MKFVFPEINHVFDTEGGKIPSLIIENQKLLYRLLSDIQSQFDGMEGLAVVSQDGKILQTDKYLELLTEFVPFIINKKNLLTKAAGTLEQNAMAGELYHETMETLHRVESFLLKISFGFNCDLSFSKISLNSLIKACGMEFNEEYPSLAEKLIDYMELVTEFERKKLFIYYNLRSIIPDEEMSKFIDTALTHGYNIFLLESSEHERLSQEDRYIVDASLCEIC